MSKISSKQRYIQLTEWLEVRKQSSPNNTNRSQPQRFSKADTYNKSRR